MSRIFLGTVDVYPDVPDTINSSDMYEALDKHARGCYGNMPDKVSKADEGPDEVISYHKDRDGNKFLIYTLDEFGKRMTVISRNRT